MGRVITLIMLLLAASMLTITNDSWAEGLAAPPPTVKLIGPNSLTEDLKAEKAKNTYTVDFNLSVENDGTQAIAAPIPQSNWIGGGYRIILVSDRSYSGSAKPPTITPGKNLVALAPTTVTTVPVTLTVYDSVTTSLTAVLVITAPSGVVPSTQAITLTRSLKASNFYGILGGSLAVGAAVLFTAWIRRPRPADEDRTDQDRQPRGIIYTDTTFSFNQSWATSIAAILTVVATVFTTTGVLSALVPGIDTGFFLAVTIVYGVVLTLAPLVYSALQIPRGAHVYGSRSGFIVAAAITGIAVGGQLSTVGAIIAVSDLPWKVRWILWALVGAVAALVVWYTDQTRRQLWHRPPPPAGSRPAKPALP
jgi:hypothetical protein